MDIKAPIEKYEKIVKTNLETQNIIKSIELIMKSGICYEFRTTVVKNLLTPKDFEKIGLLVNGAKTYYLQNFLYAKTLDKQYNKAEPFSKEELEESISILKRNNIKDIGIR